MTPLDIRRAGPDIISWRNANTITDWEMGEIGVLLCSYDPRDLALTVVRLRGQLEVAEILEKTESPAPPMTEAQMREALAEIARIAGFIDTQCYTGTVQEKIHEILALAEGKS
jgi:hypothetical protein